MSLSLTALAAAADTAAASTTATASTSGTQTSASTQIGNAALQQLGGNFNQFLNLLLTQLQNQDPTQPLDTNSFTTELVQFTGVQQEVATNSNLSQLISLQQTTQTLQASGLVGHQATVSANQLSLQNGSAQVQFTASAGQPVAIAVVSPLGVPLRTVVLNASQGTNNWVWNGQTDQGVQMPDGAYRVSVQAASGNGVATALPFSVVGTATGVATANGTTTLDLGALSVPLSAVESISGS